MFSLPTRHVDEKLVVRPPRNFHNSFAAVELVCLDRLMTLARGSAEVRIGLIDGPVATNHSAFSETIIQDIAPKAPGNCTRTESSACVHGTFVAGILSAKRGSGAPAIAPGCTLLLRPIFSEDSTSGTDMPRATPEELASAIIDTVDGGARVINLSVGLLPDSSNGERRLKEGLDYAARLGVVLVAAAGNQGSVGSSAITRHPWVIPVAACTIQGAPLNESNLGSSIGRRGLSAPGENVVSLGTNGALKALTGTSAAAPFVTATIALLCSEFANASAAQIKLAVTRTGTPRRPSIAPPVLDAWAAFQMLASAYGWRQES